jgi:histone deacetylase complex regulatory component SIN3
MEELNNSNKKDSHQEENQNTEQPKDEKKSKKRVYRADISFLEQIEERAMEDDEVYDMLINKIYPKLKKDLW